MSIIFVPQNQIQSRELDKRYEMYLHCATQVQIDSPQAVGYPFVPLGPGWRETKQSEGLVYGTT